MNKDKLIETLHTSEEKVTLLIAKRQSAKLEIKAAQDEQRAAQIELDLAVSNTTTKIKKFKLLDEILAEFKFSVRLKEEAKRRASKPRKITTAKTPEQILADVMACLESLPAEQRDIALAAMKAQQAKGEN